ncbi:MAG: hypothetical protein IT355_20035 [Gemmatimonadaceae bacterium]|nr:hypothetical protein [Gemmatimonadaceae bacterium]
MTDGAAAPRCRRALPVAGLALALTAACSRGDAAGTPPAATVAVPARDSVQPVTSPAGPMIVDTTQDVVLEVWPLTTAPGRQVEDTRRIVEHMHADLAFLPGFDAATLLASGDGTTLVLLAAWRDSLAADTASSRLAGWLRVEADTALRRRRLGTATARVQLRRTAGTPPMFSDVAMLQFTRYAVKPGHSFGALAALADSNLTMRVLRDTSAQGGATLSARDSGAVYMIVQARNATALDAALQSAGPLPFWAPFATRDEQLLAVVAGVRGRP